MEYEKRGSDKFGYSVWATTPGWSGSSFKVADARNEEWADKIVAALTAAEQAK